MPVIDVAEVEASIDRAAVRYDRDGDQHLRRHQRVHQVDPWFRRRCRGALSGADDLGGEDPRFIARRLMVHASGDIGMADPTALQTASPRRRWSS